MQDSDELNTVTLDPQTFAPRIAYALITRELFVIAAINGIKNNRRKGRSNI